MTKREWELALCKVVEWCRVDGRSQPRVAYKDEVIARLVTFAVELENRIYADPKLDGDIWSLIDRHTVQDFRVWFKSQPPTRQAKVLQQLAAEHAYYISVPVESR